MNLKEALKATLGPVLELFGYEIRSVHAPARSMKRGLAALSKFISPVSVIDVGVAEGTPELYERFSPERHAYLLIEANPRFAAAVKELADGMGAAYESVFCGSAEGSVQLHLYGDGRKASLFAITARDETPAVTNVAAQTLDALVEKHTMRPPYFLKIDVEGAELEVLKGALKTLTKCSAVVVETSVVERFRGAPEVADITSFMQSRGFSLFDFLEGTIHDGKLTHIDLVFVPTSAPFRAIRR